MKALKILAFVGVVIAVIFAYAKVTNDMEAVKNFNEISDRMDAQRQREAPIISNCESAVRGVSDRQTIRFHAHPIGTPSHVLKTDSGFLYHVVASDATTSLGPTTVLCYTNSDGQVIRIVPRGY
jgi:hypothetical protein